LQLALTPDRTTISFQKGLEGFGAKIALQLARSGFGVDLLKTVAHSGALDEWRQGVRLELLYNRSQHLSSCHPKLSGNIPDDFPDLDVLNLYINPASHENDLAASPPLTFVCTQPQVTQLAVLASTTFQWGRSAEDLFERYRDHIFPTMAVRQLIESAVSIDGGSLTAGAECCPMLRSIIGERSSPSTCFLPEYRVLLAIPSRLIRDICGSLPGPLSQPQIVAIEEVCKKYRAWLPRTMVELVRPDLVSSFERFGSKKKKRPSTLVILLGYCTVHHSHKQHQRRRRRHH
jgi:Holliday junction resolvase YEN1